MTNGEKIQTILDVDRDCTEVHGENGTMTFTVTQDFWNAEYQEPITKEHQAESDKFDAVFQDGYNNGYTQARFDYEEEPTTKNNLGVNCIDKTELLKAMDTWDKFGNDPNKGLIPLRTPALRDRYVPYVHYYDMVNCVKGMPSVTPIRPKGHWIEERNDYGEIIHWHCSNCYDDSGFMTTCKWDFCPNCGSDNREVEE